MKTAFIIGNETMDADILLFEIGADGCCYALLKSEERTFSQVKYITYDEQEAEESLAAVLEDFKNASYEKVLVCSAFAPSLLIPNRFNNNHHSLLNAIFDSSFQKHFTDSIPEWQMTAAYSLPEALVNLITEQFPSARFLHAHTLGLKVFNGFTAPNQIDIHFSTQYFRVLVKKEKQVQLAQIYSYKTPLDVVYFLLKICYEFQLDQSEVVLVVSGLIDQDSAMFTELHNYFLNLHFAQGPAYALPGNGHPHHYFTSLYNLAACVS